MSGYQVPPGEIQVRGSLDLDAHGVPDTDVLTLLDRPLCRPADPRALEGLLLTGEPERLPTDRGEVHAPPGAGLPSVELGRTGSSLHADPQAADELNQFDSQAPIAQVYPDGDALLAQ